MDSEPESHASQDLREFWCRHFRPVQSVIIEPDQVHVLRCTGIAIGSTMQNTAVCRGRLRLQEIRRQYPASEAASALICTDLPRIKSCFERGQPPVIVTGCIVSTTLNMQCHFIGAAPFRLYQFRTRSGPRIRLA